MSPGFHQGDEWERVIVEGLTRTQIVQYAGASGDFHPVHHDETVARALGYPTIFAHGMLTMALTGGLLADVVGEERLVRFGARMVGQVWPGDTLTASLVVTAVQDQVVDLDLRTVNQRGEVVLAGSATARVA